KDPFTVVGVGDMSGDVFGNGMLLSPAIKLVGAFDHRHIFVDPDPDPAKSFAERKRLFALPRSNWESYNPKLISKEGGVFPRGAKEIPLGPRLREMLGVDAEVLSGEEMIRALLSMPMDLLWNGGIGTYIKATHETHHEVGDPNNDAVRINASECRARIIGEGGNLGLTQAARIELDLRGTALHTDAIDNAGGVNMSDQEVNLKILLNALVERGDIAGFEARNKLLEALTGAVTDKVLRANFRQVMMISMGRIRSVRDVDPFIRLVNFLAREGNLDRRTEGIPNEQTLQRYQTDGHGIPRPILAVLLAYSKMYLYKSLGDSGRMGHPAMESLFLGYFPAELTKRYDLSQVQHALRDQITATVLTNLVIDQAGMCFVSEMSSFADGNWARVAEAYLVADRITSGAEFREGIYALATVLPAEEQYRHLLRFESILSEIVRWQLLQSDAGSDLFANEAAYRESFQAYCQALPGLLTPERKKMLTGEAEDLRAHGAGKALASQMALTGFLQDYPLICDLCGQGGLPIPQGHQLIETLERRLNINRIERALRGLHHPDAWQKRFGDNLHRRLYAARRGILAKVLENRQGDKPEQWEEHWYQQNQKAWSAFDSMSRQVFAKDAPDTVSLAVVIEQLERI
ncbi:MAG: NAD-glutamate dehydrogenase, partial [Deltaproteobacteria bacterium]|nr:NAD-glutamate dehydrogenase [Deltaproteobacteria bacterium]